MLIRCFRETEKLNEVHTLLSKMFDIEDCRMLALRFYYMRWILFAVQQDAYTPPFRTVDERFVFTKVALLMRDRNIPESLKKFLLLLG